MRAMSSIKRIGLVVKPHQPEALKTICELTQWLAARAIELVGGPEIERDRIQQQTGCSVREVPSDKLAQEVDLVLVLGGDGTMSNIANLLKDTGAILMPIPGGTLNHFTKDLGIPQAVPDALQYFKSAKKTKIDVGQIDGKTFINNSSIGFYSDSLFERDEHEKTYGKWPAMIISTLKAFLRYRTYKVTIDGKQYSTPLIFVGNNKYVVRGLAFQRSSLTDGTLSVYIVRGRSRLNLFFAFLSLMRGQKNIPKKLKSFTTKEVTLATNHTLRISRDGEYDKLPSPLRYKIQASSLNILQKQ